MLDQFFDGIPQIVTANNCATNQGSSAGALPIDSSAPAIMPFFDSIPCMQRAPVLKSGQVVKAVACRAYETPPRDLVVDRLPPVQEPYRVPYLQTQQRMTVLQSSRLQLMQRSTSKHIINRLQMDNSPFALRPSNPAMLESAAQALFDLVTSSVPINTAKKDRSDWQWWEQMTLELGTPAFRSDIAANLGIDEVGYYREIILECLVLLMVARRMKPKSKKRKREGMPAKPQSNNSVLLTARRVHSRFGVTMANSPLVKQVLKAMMTQYVRMYGVDALMPKRKESFTVDNVVDLLASPQQSWADSRP